MAKSASIRKGPGWLFGWIVAFAILLGLAGIGLRMAAAAGEAVLSWQRVQDWQPVTARLEALDLKPVPKRDPGSRAAVVSARYRYTFNGKDYSGDRVGGYEGSHAVDGWHGDVYDRLRASTRHGRGRTRELTAWVDPAHPEQAVLDRSLRWVVPLVLLPVAAFFLGLATMMGHGMRLHAMQRAVAPSPAIERLPGDPDIAEVEAWRTGVVSSDILGSVALAWLFPFMAGVTGWGIAISGYSHGKLALSGGAAVLGFGTLGAVLLLSAVKKTLRYFRQGQIHLQLTPFPARLGQELRGTIRLPVSRVSEEVTVALGCMRERYDSDDTLTNDAIWDHLSRIRPQPAAAGAVLNFSVPLPGHLPASAWRSPSRKLKVGVKWIVHIEAADAGLDHAFTIPVLADPRISPQPAPASDFVAETREMDELVKALKAVRAKKIESHAGIPTASPPAKTDPSLAEPYIERRGAEWRLDTRRQPHMKRIRWSGLAFLVIAPFGAIFPALWVAMARWHGTLAEIALTVIGGFVVLLPALMVPFLGYLGIQRLSKRVRVSALGGHVEVRRQHWLWSDTTRFDTSAVVGVRTKSMGIEMGSRRSYRYYTIIASLADGREVELAWSVRDTDVAEALAGVLKRLCGSTGKAVAGRVEHRRHPGVLLLIAIVLAAAVPLAAVYSPRIAEWDGHESDSDRIAHLSAQLAGPGLFHQWLSARDTLKIPPRWLLTHWMTEARSRLAATRRAPPDAPVIAVPLLPAPIMIDGLVGEAEWRDAARVKLQPEYLGSLLRLASDGEHLFVAAEVPADTTREGFDRLSLSLHFGLAPTLLSERIGVNGHGRDDVQRSVVARAEDRDNKIPYSQPLDFEKLKSASAVDGYRRYEVSIDLAEAGLTVGAPFTLSAQIEGDPQRHPDGKFSKRTYLGDSGGYRQPLWLNITR